MSGRLRSDEGETLAEVLVAVAVLGIAVSALLGGIGASATGSDVHRKQAQGEVVLRAYAEMVENADFVGTSCANAVTAYKASTLGFTAPTGYTVSNPTVVNQSPGTGTCTYLQLVTLSVVTNRTTLTLSLVKQAT